MSKKDVVDIGGGILVDFDNAQPKTEIVPNCNHTGCSADATVALRTTRPSSRQIKTTIFWDARHWDVPKKAELLCTEHAMQTVTELSRVLTT